MTKTLDYYNQNASQYSEGTYDADVSLLQQEFMSRLKPGSLILDFGCGSGRDTRSFLDHGFQVEATDGSEELCRIASAHTGISVRQMLFQDLHEQNRYDGIWACASILHLNKTDLQQVLQQMADALKDQGIAYISFKYGDFEGIRNERYFTYLKEDSLQAMLDQIPSLSLTKEWITGDVRQDRHSEQWLNAIVTKRAGVCNS
ncbi:MAG: class I SAM-dependent methyltransferase [Solobacterium sp.]|jgi:SAM-dependent methyltransferase|nr:class I SAM-dependent methyltransferase [Solobacterium sp.]